MKLAKKKYKKIIKLKKEFKFKEFDLITNYGLFSGDTNLFKTLVIYDLIKEISLTKGDVIELGIHKGNTSLLIKKILDIFKIKKKLFLLDHFRGLIHYNKKDTKLSLTRKNKYKSNKNQIESFIKFFNFKKIKIINQDATKLKPNFFKPKQKFALAYFDMDLYLPTLNALKAIDKNISVGGLIVFDQGHKSLWSEKLAIKDFLKINNNYKKIHIDKTRQPDVILKKIRPNR
jgi:hypothetical protein